MFKRVYYGTGNINIGGTFFPIKYFCSFSVPQSWITYYIWAVLVTNYYCSINISGFNRGVNPFNSGSMQSGSYCLISYSGFNRIT